MKTEIRKALETTGDGAGIVATSLEPILSEELMKQQPLAQLLSFKPANGKTHEYTIRTSHPHGWFEGEGTQGANSNSRYERKSVQTKIQRIWGEVTGFSQAVSEPFIDALTAELEGSVEGMSNLMEFGALWGCAGEYFSGDSLQYTGIFPTVAKLAPGNIIDAGGAKISLDMLDQGIAKACGFRGVREDSKLFAMSTRMRQVVDGLQTRVTIPLSNVELADGKIVMRAYDTIPIMESDYTAPEQDSSSPSDMSGAPADGGNLAVSTAYSYRIASITLFGEQVAASAVVATTGAAQGTVNLSWSADANAKLYAIFRKGATGDFAMVDIIPALAYDGTGAVSGFVETYIDNGSKTPVAVKPLETGEQNVFLTNTSEKRGVSYVGLIDDMGSQVDNLISYVPLARTKDAYGYFLKSYMAAVIKYPNLSAMVRHVKTA